MLALAPSCVLLKYQRQTKYVAVVYTAKLLCSPEKLWLGSVLVLLDKRRVIAFSERISFRIFFFYEDLFSLQDSSSPGGGGVDFEHFEHFEHELQIVKDECKVSSTQSLFTNRILDFCHQMDHPQSFCYCMYATDHVGCPINNLVLTILDRKDWVDR